MDDTPLDTPETLNAPPPEREIPFNNLYLVSGFVHGFNKGAMYLFTSMLLVFFYFLFQVIIMYPLMSRLMSNGYTMEAIKESTSLIFDAGALGIDKNVVLLLELGMFVFGFLGFYLGIRFFHHKSLVSVLTGYEKFRFKRFWFAFAVWGGFILISLLVDYFFLETDLTVQTESSAAGIPHFNYTGFIISAVILFLLMPIQTGLEEVFFRGYLIQGLSQIFKNGYIPLIITSLLFGLAHMTNPEVKAYGWPIMLTYFCAFALFMGAITLLDEGLELAFGIHFANNLMSCMLVSSPNSVIKGYSLFETKTEDPYTEMLVWFVAATIVFLIFWRKYRWKNFSLILK